MILAIYLVSLMSIGHPNRPICFNHGTVKWCDPVSHHWICTKDGHHTKHHKC